MESEHSVGRGSFCYRNSTILEVVSSADDHKELGNGRYIIAEMKCK